MDFKQINETTYRKENLREKARKNISKIILVVIALIIGLLIIKKWWGI